MRVFGIDCGTNCPGYGVLDVHVGPRETRLSAVAAGGSGFGGFGGGGNSLTRSDVFSPRS